MNIKAVSAFSLLAALLAQPATAQPTMLDEPSAGVKACITQHAADVERTIESLDEATTFLLQKICAAELGDQASAWMIEEARRSAEAARARRAEMCATQLDRAPPSDTKDRQVSILQAMCDADYEGMYELSGGASVMWAVDFVTAPKATAFTAQTLLQLRVKRLGAKP